MEKLYDRIDWHNNTTPAINETNLNKMSKALDDLDDRVILIAGDVLVTVPQLREMLEDCTELEQRLEAMTENPPYIGENGHWYIWDTDTGAYVDSGIDASITVEIADITMLAPNATPYVTNTGTDTDPIFHLFIPRGQPGKGISSIAKTGTSGYVDTYTITYTDGTTTTYTVTNGRNTDQMPGFPLPSAQEEGTIYQYVGQTTSSYTHGFYYECRNVNGTYKWVNIPVGNDPVEVSNSEPYTYRQSKGNLADMEIVGASVGWNQLARPFGTTYYSQTNIASVSYTDNVATFTANAQDGRIYLGADYRPAIYSNHVYFASVKVKPSTSTNRIQLVVGSTTKAMPVESASWTEIAMIMSPSSDSNNPVIGVRDHRTSGWDAVQAKELVFTDLTQDFNPTVADAIYAMEQATAGAGVAFFRKYFPKDYYAYDAGSIQSVCVGSRKVAQFYNFDHSNVLNAYINDSTGIITSSSAGSKTVYFYAPTGEYRITKRESSTFRIALYENMPVVGSTIVSGSIVKLTTEKECIYTTNRDGWIAIFCVNAASAYDLENAQRIIDSIEVYKTVATYPFDSTKELRGMFSLVGGELKASGDTYYGDGSITRTWTKLSNQTGAIGDTITLTGLKTNGTVLCSDGLISDIGTISGTTLTLTKAISGADFVYELATPTTESAQPYQNPQRAYIDGTEEFTDGLTRDVMIPVGNNTVYQQDKILPSVEDYVDGVTEPKADISAIGTNETGSTASQAYSIGQHFYKDGKFCTAISAIASGGTFTLNTNYTESDIATLIASLETRITELES